MNVNELKRQLQSLGISTSTPGLQGDERYEELSFRLESFNKQPTQQQIKKAEDTQHDEFVVPSLNQLSIGEIRSRLSALGESTSTPGVTGEERRNMLMRRLINAVCMDNAESDIHEIASKAVAPVLVISPPKQVRAPSPPPPEPVGVVPTVPAPAAAAVEEEIDTTVSSATISALKKDLKRLVNQRAMAVAARLSGNSQDEKLREEEAKLSRIEAEMMHFRALQAKGETKLPTESIQSEFLVLNPAALGFAIEALINRLEGYRSSAKEKIRNHRLRIREEGDEHPLYGVAAEEQLKARLSEANLASAANVTNTNAGKVSRTRLKIAEVKMLETKLEEEGKVLVDNSQSPVNNKAAPVTQNISSAGQLPSSLKVEPTAPTSAQPIAASTVGAPVATGGASSKWSTDLNSLGKFDVNAKSPSVDPIGKVPAFTSSFLGKAIDLGGSPGSQRAPPPEVKSPSEQRIEAAMHAAMTKPMTSVTASGKPAALAPPSGHASGISVINAAPVARPNSSTRGGPPPPVIQGRRPPPNAPPTAEVGEVATGASAARHISTPAARLPYADGSDDNEDEYGERVEEDEGEGYDEADSFFQEADDAALPEERGATAKVYPVRGLPLPKVPSASSSRNDVKEEEEEEGVERYDSAGELRRDDSNADFDQLYGTRRRAPTVEDDDDLEELSTARSQLRTQSRNSGAEDRTADTTTAASSTPSPVLDTSPLPTHTAAEEHMVRMPSIDENDASEGPPGSRRGSLQQDGDRDRVERKLDYVTVDPLPAAEESPREDEGEGDRDEDAQEGLEGHDGEEDPEDADQEREADEKTQIRVLRSHAKVLEGLKDIPAAEAVHMRALELDPTNIATLEGFAMFLHQKKGELARAEAFFNRGLQVCLPGLSLRTSATNTPMAEHKKDKMAQSGVSFGTDASMQGNKITHIVRFIMSYAHFMNKSKGDIEAAGILYRKGIELAPENALLLATYAHFLAQLGDKESSAAAMEYFQKALKFSPGNGQYCMWYGKLLKKMGKVGQAELMYKVALEQSKGNETLEPTAICNYATFVFKQRKDPVRAHALFVKGLESFPAHKGLRKNHGALLKACPQVVGGEGAPAAPQRREQPETSKGAARAEWLARRAQKALQEQMEAEKPSAAHIGANAGHADDDV